MKGGKNRIGKKCCVSRVQPSLHRFAEFRGCVVHFLSFFGVVPCRKEKHPHNQTSFDRSPPRRFIPPPPSLTSFFNFPPSWQFVPMPFLRKWTSVETSIKMAPARDFSLSSHTPTLLRSGRAESLSIFVSNQNYFCAQRLCSTGAPQQRACVCVCVFESPHVCP